MQISLFDASCQSSYPDQRLEVFASFYKKKRLTLALRAAAPPTPRAVALRAARPPTPRAVLF
jgi:hypothetical protein